MYKQVAIKGKFLRFIKKHKKKTLRHTLVALLIGVVLLGLINLPNNEKSSANNLALTYRSEDTQFVATLVGDVFLDGYFYRAIEKKGATELTEYVQEIFAESDFVTGSMNGPTVTNPLGNVINASNINQITNESVSLLKSLKFSVVSLANDRVLTSDPNHLERKMEAFSRNGIATVGAGLNLEQAKKIYYQEVNGLTIATLGMADMNNIDLQALVDRPGILYANPLVYFPLIAEAKSNADLVIVHVNWGEQYASHVDAEQKNMAKAISDAGADIIVGHKAQVLQSVEIYRNTVILYNLGNVFFGQGFTLTQDSVFVRYILNRDGTAHLEIIPIEIRNAQPRPATGQLNWLKRKNIFYRITRDLPQDWSWYAEGDKLIVQIPEKKGAANNGI